MTIDIFWQNFLAQANLPKDTTYYESSYFGVDGDMADSLLALVLSGQKRATASCLRAYEAEGSKQPQIGDYSIITDWHGTPHCVIQTTDITIIPFNEMTYDIAKREGEDDCLETWLDNHRYCFTLEGQELGFEFTEDMLVLFEDFQVVYQP